MVAVLPAVLALFVIFVLVMPQVREGRNTNKPQIVSTFEGCVSAGNPVMESYPRQCRHGEQLYVEEVDITLPNGYVLDGYSVAKVTGVSCVEHEECDTPMDYLIWSNCPYMSLCLEQKCTVVCPVLE